MYASKVLWDKQKSAGGDRKWWNKQLRSTPLIRRQNTVESGFWANVQMAFNTGWSIGFVPIDWKGLRFFIHDNLPTSPYRVNSENGDAVSNADEEKFWKLKEIWENRKLLPMIARFEFFNVGHPVNEQLSMKWLFKREYFPFTGFMALVQLHFKKASTKARTNIVLGGEVWPFDLVTTSTKTQTDLRLRAGIVYTAKFEVSTLGKKAIIRFKACPPVWHWTI